MPDDGNNKRMRMSPPDSPNIDGMEVIESAMENDRKPRAASDASSDWDDWADAMVAQGEPAAEASAEDTAGEGGAGSIVDSTGREDDEWVQTMMDQGTLGSVVESVESRAWDYVLQMVVDGGEEYSGATTVASPAQEVNGAAATEFVSRWLRHNLPVASPALNMLAPTAAGYGQHQLRTGNGDGHHRRPARRRALVDSVAQPSAVAVVSCSPEQRTHRMSLFSLNGNAGAALAAAVVQPGAAGLIFPEDEWREEPKVGAHFDGSGGGSCVGELTERRRPGAGRRDRGVVFEALDSRILEDALVSAMGRLGLGLRRRSRSGVWKLRPGTVLPTAHVPAPSVGEVSPLSLDDAGFIARHYGRCSLHGSAGDQTTPSVGDIEAVVRGLIVRNPSVGIRRRNQLVAWSLSFDCGLAGALHVSPSSQGMPVPHQPHGAAPSSGGGYRANGEREGNSDNFSTHNLVLALLTPLLSQSAGTEGVDPNVSDRNPSPLGESGGDGDATPAAQHNLGPAGPPARSEKIGSSDSSSGGGGGEVGAGLDGVVLDDDSPFARLFRELDLLERVCDADWMRFEPAAAGNGSGSGKAAGVLVDGVDGQLPSEGGPLPSPLVSILLHP
ncbi:unnamed protein product [Scytosiphon promiscuus]